MEEDEELEDVGVMWCREGRFTERRSARLEQRHGASGSGVLGDEVVNRVPQVSNPPGERRR